MKIVNPTTEEIIQDIAVDSESVLLSKLDVLQKAQLEWAETDVETRVKIIHRFIELLKENIEALALILTSEMGKPLQQSRNEINGASGKAAWLADNAVKYLSEEIMSISDQMQEKISYEPLGVICNISAWNYPYNVGVNVFVPALLAGNAVMYKPSEFATLTGIEIEKYLKKAGLPDGVFQVAIGQGEVGKFLLELPFDGYFFTGSYQTGNFIYEKVAKKMVPCQLELGGKDPVYVCDDVVDVASAAIGIADGAFYNNGQSCCSVERIYVHEKIYDAFVEAFTAEVKSWKMGSPLEEGVYISVLSRPAQVDFLTFQVEDAIQKGAKVETGGKALEGKGYYFQPTVLSQVNHEMSIMKEESFGPVIGIMKVADDAEAIRLMNDTAYGLTAGVYSSSENRATEILKQINSGTAYWNCCDRVSAALPWSGRGHSGFGSTLSHMGLRAFTKPKAYHLRRN
jgi:acyl-CoA reductase-like NAD-dependent aldehyde dehydrogenase